ncbi:putative syntaxin [Kockovaella imperatae]|uniref:Putative syntaxin n=1 Tax=Kockovaella imperatae TaxID=4999 RepID=A0A1Y1UE48_9TREE|nr:putative syntaxin [Kockovaella imperatae]ORX36320.1 putative syntaxin [Kockovaella imperatae]
MARNRLAGVNQQYGDSQAPGNSYPPPSNAVVGQSRSDNPYAQQDYSAAPGPGNYNQYNQQSYGAGNGAPAGGDFWAELSSTNTNLAQLQEEIQAVRTAHQQSLASTDPQATAYADQLNDQARATREQCKNQIKRLFKMTKGDKAMKGQAEAVKTRFTSLLNEHQVVEKEFRKKVKDRVERQYRIVNPQATDEEVRQVTESDNPQVFSQALLSSNRYGAARGAFREVQERHAEIQKIERTLTELAQMFQEMSMLVEQQDETIANVEQQAMGVDQNISEGLNQTTRAVDSARKARRKKWICFWICILIICVAIAITFGVLAAEGKFNNNNNGKK